MKLEAADVLDAARREWQQLPSPTALSHIDQTMVSFTEAAVMIDLTWNGHAQVSLWSESRIGSAKFGSTSVSIVSAHVA